MTTPLTPEVLAAMDRMRGYYCGPWPEQYHEPGGTILHEQDRDRCLRAMLSLFPPGLPAPAEMFTSDMNDTIIVATGHRLIESQVIRGLFIPLERLETP